MKMKYYKALLTVSTLMVLSFFYSCDLNSPVDIELVGVSVENLDFELFTDELVFTVENGDTVSAAWDIRTWPGWISVNPTQGTLTRSGIDTFYVTVSRDGLDVGDYSGDIYIDFQGVSENLYVQVDMSISPVPIFTTKQINLNSSDTRGNFKIDNQGNYPYKWKVVSDQSWLTASPDSGTTDPTTVFQNLKLEDEKEVNDEATISFDIDRRDLSPGVHIGLLEIQSNSGNDSVFVTVPQDENPLLSVSDTQLNFDANTLSRTITIDNIGGGILDWQAASPDNWVTITPDNGTISTQALLASLSKYNILTKTLSVNEMQVEVSVRIAELSPGDIPSQIDITSNGGNETIALSVNVPEQPVLDLSERILDFGSSLSSLSFDIINTGTGGLDWQATPSDASLTVAPANGSTTTSETIQVDLDRTLLQNTGNLTFSIDITSDGGNESVEVRVTVLTPPLLAYTPTAIEINENALTHTLLISNDGEEPLNWKLIPNANWVTVSVDSGITTTQTSEITVAANLNVELQPGTHTTTIDIQSDGGNGQVAVTAVVPEDPALGVAPKILDFGTNQRTMTFDINNVGSGLLTWGISVEGTFFTLDVREGDTTTETDQVTVNVDRDDLDSGDYIGLAIIESDGGIDTVEIRMTVRSNPQLAVSDEFIDFGVGSVHERIDVKNEGNDRVFWEASIEFIYDNKISVFGADEGDWLSIDPVSGTTSNQTTLDLFAHREFVYQRGVSEAIVHITSNAGNKDILVHITSEAPAIEVLPVSLDFGPDLDMLEFGVKNIGGGELDWASWIDYQIADMPSWLSISPEFGNTTDKTDVQAFVDRKNMPGGIYEAMIRFESSGGYAEISVIMEVVGPVLDLSTYNINFGPTAVEIPFDVLNVGGGSLDWHATVKYIDADPQLPPWLWMAPDYGSTPDKTTVTAYATRNMLPSGVHHADIEINSNGGTKVVNCEITIQPSSINVTPLQLDFGVDKSRMTVDIANGGGGILNYNITTVDQWILVSPAGGSVSTGSDVITVDIDRSAVRAQLRGLHSGTNQEVRGTFQIQNLDDANNHETVEVIMIIAPPQIGLDPLMLDFGETETEKTFDIKNIGNGTLNYSFWTEDPWISLSQYSGSVGSEKHVITVTIQRGMPSSPNSGIKTRTSSSYQVTGWVNVENVDDANDTGVIEIRATMLEPPILHVPQTDLNFGTSETNLLFEIQNLGEDVLEWGLLVDGPHAIFVHIDAANGTTTTETDIVNVSIDRSLPPGIYDATISILSNGGNSELNVSWEILE